MRHRIEIRSEGASFRNEVVMGKHRLWADEPVSAGGNDSGPTPYDLLAAALGSCKSMTIYFYAKREGIPVEGIEVEVAHDREHAKDCADCESKQGYIHRFVSRIRVTGSLTDEQRQKLLSIAKRCPVAKTLTSEIKIEDELSD